MTQIMDDIMKEIFNRDSRTAGPMLKVKTQSTNLEFNEIEEICDKSQIKSTKRSTLRNGVGRCGNCSKRLFNFITVALSIYILIISTSQSEASPITSSASRPKRQSEDTVFAHKCGTPTSERGPRMNDTLLKRRLTAILLSCQDTLAQTKDLSEQYIKIMWNTTIQKHHEAWKHHKVPSWIHPEGVPLKKQYSENISSEHKSELEAIQWKDHQKVFEYLGKIYQRLERIYVGVQIVNKWIEVATKNPAMMNKDELEKSKELFQNVTGGIRAVLCEIQDLFMDVEIDPSSDLDITPFRMDDLIKINHWLIYREYQNLMEYSNELLNLIIERYGESN